MPTSFIRPCNPKCSLCERGTTRRAGRLEKKKHESKITLQNFIYIHIHTVDTANNVKRNYGNGNERRKCRFDSRGHQRRRRRHHHPSIASKASVAVSVTMTVWHQIYSTRLCHSVEFLTEIWTEISQNSGWKKSRSLPPQLVQKKIKKKIIVTLSQKLKIMANV